MSKLEQMEAHLRELVFEKLDTTSLQRLSQTSAALKDATFQFRLHKAMDYYDDAPAAVWQNATVLLYVRSGRCWRSARNSPPGLLYQTFDTGTGLLVPPPPEYDPDYPQWQWPAGYRFRPCSINRL